MHHRRMGSFCLSRTIRAYSKTSQKIGDPSNSLPLSYVQFANGKPTPNFLSLTAENVELVLHELRPHLRSDGGDVALVEVNNISGVVTLELQGACTSCPSSSTTLKFGLEKQLKERIPSIVEVVQKHRDPPPINHQEVEVVLETIRPFLVSYTGDTLSSNVTDLISVESISEPGQAPTVITLLTKGTMLSIYSVRMDIARRIQQHFTIPLHVKWVK